MSEDITKLVERLLRSSSSLKDARITTVEALAGDASQRRFYRVNFSQGKLKQAILMVHPTPGKDDSKARKASSDQSSFVELSRYFSDHGIAVPIVYHSSETEHAVLLEDVGNLGLWMYAEDSLTDEGEAVKDMLGTSWKRELFKNAITVIKQFQSIPFDNRSIAFKRSQAFEQYRQDAQEFIDFYTVTIPLKLSEGKEMGSVFDALCETMASFPKKLSHYDYNAHNLFVSSEGKIRVLDFQDAQLTSPTRDIVSLINDRGMDEILGRSLHSDLIRLYQEILEPGPSFQEWYEITLLHWDFRVVGRFHKLTKNLNTDRYLQWVPGTLRRLGRTLQRSYRRIHHLEHVLEILERLAPELRDGVRDPWDFPC